jgi:hypothetical protein
MQHNSVVGEGGAGWMMMMLMMMMMMITFKEIFHKRIFLSKYQCLQICSSFVMDDGAFPRDFFMLQSFDKKMSGQIFIFVKSQKKASYPFIHLVAYYVHESVFVCNIFGFSSLS